MTRAAAAVMKRPAVGATTVATKAKATAMKTSTAMKASPARKAPCAMKVTVMKTSAMKVSAMKVTAMKTTVMKATAKKGSAMKGTALKKPPVKKKLTTTKAVRRKPAVKKVPAKKKRPPAWRDAIEGLVKTKRCKDFLRYAHRIEEWIEQLHDYFWTFCSKLWASKDINDGNIEAEAVAGAKAYVEQLRQTGILSA
eukprot:g5160.t1